MQPPGRWLNWATGSPATNGDSVGPFSSRRTVTFSAANSPNGSAVLSAAVTGATASAACTVRGWNLYDSSVGGTVIMFGTLTATATCRSRTDAMAFSAGVNGLNITLS